MRAQREQVEQARSSVTLMLAGDLMTGRGIDQAFAHPAPAILHEACVHDARVYLRLAQAANGAFALPIAPDYPWGDALACLRDPAVALRIANLETAITRRGEPCAHKAIHYRMHPANAHCLRAGGFDALSLANNHAMDWGAVGLRDTLRRLRRLGVQPVGAGEDAEDAWTPAALPLPGGGRLLMIAFAFADAGVPMDWSAQPGRAGIAVLAQATRQAAREVLARVAAWRCSGDRTMVSIHWGANRVAAPPLAHRRFARELIDSGTVDLVHGHSSHPPLPAELYRGRLILYGCGDLLNDYEGIDPTRTVEPAALALYRVELARDDGRLLGFARLPLRLRRFRLEAGGAAGARGLPPLPPALCRLTGP